MEDFEAALAEVEAAAALTEAEIWANPGSSTSNIEGDITAITKIKSISTALLLPITFIAHITWHNVEGQYNANGLTVDLGPFYPASPSIALTSQHEHPLDCVTSPGGWVSAEGEHGGQWIVEASINGIGISAGVDRGPVRTDDREECPLQTVEEDTPTSGGEEGTVTWCRVRWTVDPDTGEWIDPEILYCWEEEDDERII